MDSGVLLSPGLDTTFPPHQLAYQTGVGCFISVATAVCKLAEVVGFQHFSCAAWFIPRLNFSWSICGYNDLSLVSLTLCQSLPHWKYYNVKLIIK